MHSRYTTVSSTVMPNSTNATSSGHAMPASSDLYSTIMTLLSLSALREWAKLFVVGGALETSRHHIAGWWNSLMATFWITATLDAGDPSYRWVLFWLSRQPFWSYARTVEISTRDDYRLKPDDDDNDDNDEDGAAFRMNYLPKLENTYATWFRRRYMTISREQTQDGMYSTRRTLDIRILSRDRAILQQLFAEARQLHKMAENKVISIYVVDRAGEWTYTTSRPKRPLSSIILEPGIKELILNDARDFLSSHKWYADRGIPFRRGYLLYGAPGSGKTSLIQSIAGELGLDVYIVSLGRACMDDNDLNELISNMPRRCIALMEDIDAAFRAGITRDLPEDAKRPSQASDNLRQEDGPTGGRDNQNRSKSDGAAASRVTLSGLLNALDEIGAQEGRILFATTNNYKALDPALCRPGRMDIHVEFRLASRHQIESLFKCFFMADDDLEAEAKREG